MSHEGDSGSAEETEEFQDGGDQSYRYVGVSKARVNGQSMSKYAPVQN
ncbi:hypothetical protein GBAR_LOCUS28385 [Geodia barretti]|uniref:Uncharacterized protein n=1 Tax=Geodia barretti TaxID=519541 RepID=A0AA35TQI2_GEOBA|nr:hypothetical protein GBAR_LOCUS28385 [Geodia barretti]